MLFENGSLQFLDFETFKSKVSFCPLFTHTQSPSPLGLSSSSFAIPVPQQMTVAKSRLPGVDHIVRFKPGILAFLIHN